MAYGIGALQHGIVAWEISFLDLDRACTGHVSILNCSMELIRKK